MIVGLRDLRVLWGHRIHKGQNILGYSSSRDLDPQKQVVFRWDLDLTRVSCGITAISCVLCLRVGVLQQEELQLIPSVSHRTGIFLSCELSQILGIVSV